MAFFNILLGEFFQFLVNPLNFVLGLFVGQGAVDHVIGEGDFLGERHLALDAAEGFRFGEVVAIVEPLDLGLLVSRHDEHFVHALVRSGFDQDRRIIDHNALGLQGFDRAGELGLFPRHARMDDGIEFLQLGRAAKDDLPKGGAVQRAVRLKRLLAKNARDVFEGRLAAFDDHAGEHVGINKDGSAVLEKTRDTAFAARNATSEPDQNHGGA